MKEIIRKSGRVIIIILSIVLTAIVASIITGVLAGVSTAAAYNPFTTIAYLLTAYLFGYFYEATKKQLFGLCLVALILSFIVNFVTGLLFLVLLPPVLKKLKVI